MLHSGERLIVEREVQLAGRHEIGQRPPIKEQTLTFRMPSDDQQVTWTDSFAPELGTANFLPMMLEIHSTGTYLVVHPMGCLSYNKWGRPNPPYVLFRHQQGGWQRVELSRLPVELNVPNLVFSSPEEQAERLSTSLVSAQDIKKLYAGYRQAEFREILRRPVSPEPCPTYSSGPKAPNPIK